MHERKNMNRKLKALGLAFVALLALTGLSSAAIAAEFHSETAHTSISGEQPFQVARPAPSKMGNMSGK
jgi:hypothetical protein